MIWIPLLVYSLYPPPEQIKCPVPVCTPLTANVTKGTTRKGSVRSVQPSWLGGTSGTSSRPPPTLCGSCGIETQLNVKKYGSTTGLENNKAAHVGYVFGHIGKFRVVEVQNFIIWFREMVLTRGGCSSQPIQSEARERCHMAPIDTRSDATPPVVKGRRLIWVILQDSNCYRTLVKVSVAVVT